MMTAQRRKARSEAILTEAGVDINPNLPLVEEAGEIRLRTVEEIVSRALCTFAVAAHAGGVDREFFEDWLEKAAIRQELTAVEAAFLGNSSPSERDEIQFSWRVEACWTLLWTLGFVPELGLPTEQIEPDQAIEIVDRYGRDGLMKEAVVRSLDEILTASDLIYRAHWAIVNSRLAPTQTGKLDPGVTYERHYALNWTIGYMDQGWDEISTDT